MVMGRPELRGMMVMRRVLIVVKIGLSMDLQILEKEKALASVLVFTMVFWLAPYLPLDLAQCFTFSERLNSNGSDIDAGFASTRTRGCRNANLAPLDLVTPNSFDNNYFKNLIQKKGLLESDQTLFGGGPTDSIVSQYSSNPATFKSDFAAAMIKMGDIIDPITSQNGLIRRICSALN
ncbi:lignin-forming anionic peroxidase-like [Rhododendron vialii]|uniref:lignin-forming anionic peroxidase-like n=1 Tax=Rhododendron vialii TaxID=182163 RepID=UPI00265DA6E1|nr:lignin-forming anionic peroxidase-like [Rhododendron vialii]